MEAQLETLHARVPQLEPQLNLHWNNVRQTKADDITQLLAIRSFSRDRDPVLDDGCDAFLHLVENIFQASLQGIDASIELFFTL